MWSRSISTSILDNIKKQKIDSFEEEGWTLKKYLRKAGQKKKKEWHNKLMKTLVLLHLSLK